MPTPEIPQKSPIRLDLEPGTYWWCACGRSKSQPWCDGSHKGTDFSPQQLDIAEACTKSICACKHSANKPFCDGAHKTLP